MYPSPGAGREHEGGAITLHILMTPWEIPHEKQQEHHQSQHQAVEAKRVDIHLGISVHRGRDINSYTPHNAPKV